MENGKYYWIKDTRGKKWEPARYVAAYKAGDMHNVPERWIGTSGDASVADIGPRIIDPDEPEFYPNDVLSKVIGIVRENEDSEYDTNNLYDRLRELVWERERCAGIIRNVLREFNRVGIADKEWCQSMLRLAVIGMNPDEVKVSLTREQEIKDAIAEAEMNERERCANIAEAVMNDEFCQQAETRASVARAIAAKIRSGK